jgi:hypothetical protein
VTRLRFAALLLLAGGLLLVAGFSVWLGLVGGLLSAGALLAGVGLLELSDGEDAGGR